MQGTYTLPTEYSPGLKIDDHLKDIIELAEWIEAAGVKISNTRIERYINYLQKCNEETEKDEIGKRIFTDPHIHPFNCGTDRYLYVLREVHELMWIVSGLKNHMPKGIETKLGSLIRGSDFAALDRDSSSRNIQFELRIASYFCREGFEVDLSTNSDIVATFQDDVYCVECKRISSSKSFNHRLSDAKKQIKNSIPKNSYRLNYYALIAIDVTRVAFEHNGLVFSITPEHSRQIMQEK